MCSHYEGPPDAAIYRRAFGVEPAAGVVRTDIWPGYESAFIRRPVAASHGVAAAAAPESLTEPLPSPMLSPVPSPVLSPVPKRQTVRGLFGLVPHWAKDTALAKRTYNARSETVAQKPSFRDAWQGAQHCIIPAMSFFEPDWRSGRAVPTRISRADGQPMGLAGLWSSWRSPQGEVVFSFTMLTINAQDHLLMRHFHRPTDEKRMVVVLPEHDYDAWLDAEPPASMDLLRAYPAENLLAEVPAAAAAPAGTPFTPGLW